MHEKDLRKLMRSVAAGGTSPDEALARLKDLPFADLGYAVVDHHRQLRQGYPEVIYGEGKTAEQIAGIAREIGARAPLLVTRLAPEKLEPLARAIPRGTYHPLSRTFAFRPPKAPRPRVRGTVAVVCAGTSDLPVAEEAAITLATAGHPVQTITDVGVAGLHRLLNRRHDLAAASVIVAVAGMEGTLPTAIAGLTAAPVVAVPTSVGYGASLKGVAALLAMLTSCAPNVAVVNIDNGFGGGTFAAVIEPEMSVRVLLIEPAGGCSGDMLLAALLDAGAPEDAVRAGLAAMELPGFRLLVSRAAKAGIHGTRVEVEVTGQDEHERSLAEIRPLLARLPEVPRRLALQVFEALATAEAHVHDSTVDAVHFHEVGAVDSIVDIAGTALALDALQVERVHATAPPLGTGIAQSRHGPIPVPAPATLELLRGRPVRSAGEGERTTPTGAAFLAALTSPQPLHSFVPIRVGYGIGHRDFPDAANVLRATVGTTSDTAGEIVELACNLDDATPQVLARALEAVLAAGALDAWIAPVTMKKGRPAHLIGVLVPAMLRERVTDVLLRETPTLGVRYHSVQRDVLDRRFDPVETRFGTVRVKVALRGDEVLGATPEWEDCLAAAAASGATPARVRDEALARWLLRGA